MGFDKSSFFFERDVLWVLDLGFKKKTDRKPKPLCVNVCDLIIK